MQQTFVANSTMEAEFDAINTATRAVEYFCGILQGLPILRGVTPLVLNDNMSAITHIHTEFSNLRTRHIAVRYHSVRERVQAAVPRLFLEHVSTKDMLADILTKALHTDEFIKQAHRLVAEPGKSTALLTLKRSTIEGECYPDKVTIPGQGQPS
jgi:hypothetical protein